MGRCAGAVDSRKQQELTGAAGAERVRPFFLGATQLGWLGGSPSFLPPHLWIRRNSATFSSGSHPIIGCPRAVASFTFIAFFLSPLAWLSCPVPDQPPVCFCRFHQRKERAFRSASASAVCARFVRCFRRSMGHAGWGGGGVWGRSWCGRRHGAFARTVVACAGPSNHRVSL